MGMGLTTHMIKAKATLIDANAALHAHWLMQMQRCVHMLSKQHGIVVSQEVCHSLSWLLEQVAVGTAQVIKLKTMLQ